MHNGQTCILRVLHLTGEHGRLRTCTSFFFVSDETLTRVFGLLVYIAMHGVTADVLGFSVLPRIFSRIRGETHFPEIWIRYEACQEGVLAGRAK
jgi:hypothetical protein